MNAQELNSSLEGKCFRYKGKDHKYKSCKSLNSYFMITTDRETFQISRSEAEDFLDNLEIISEENRRLPAKQDQLLAFEGPKTFERLNMGFESLLDALDSPDADLDALEKKSRILTSIGQTAISMENTKIGLIKAINNQ